MRTAKRMGFGLWIIYALTAAGCSSGAENKDLGAMARVDAQPPVALGVSINAVMVSLVDHASHHIWDAAAPGKMPKTDKDWQEIEHHAMQVAASGSVISMAGTGKADAGWVKNPEWQRYSKELADTGVEAANAARAHDVKALSDIGNRLVSTCEGCHKLYKGDLPSEGILHPHH